MNLTRANVLGTTFLLALLCVPFTILAQEAENVVPFADGEAWQESSHLEKVAYIVGISNLLDAEYAFQQKSGNPPRAEQSIIGTMWEYIDDISIDQAIRRIDQWYEDHPNETDTVVIDVIWVDMVKPNLD